MNVPFLLKKIKIHVQKRGLLTQIYRTSGLSYCTVMCQY